MKSPIKWMGGKSRSVNKILSIIPKHKLNDINGDLVNFFEVLRTQPNKFIERMNLVLKSRNLFFKYKQTMSDINLSPLERAFRFYYINQNSFGGIIRYNSKGKCNSSFACNPDREKQSSFWNISKIKNAHERLKESVIEQDDYKNIIQKYDREYTLFFLDPPYKCSGKYNGQAIFDYNELLNQCRNIKGKFILTLNSNFEQMFKEFNIIPN